ncbi:MAG: hypothetical protein KKC20_14035 [Proteobacteria bacterium]|nr:hypothetical protein [Pseudomonadota bacterium]
MAPHKKSISAIAHPKLIVMPFQPFAGQAFDGIGLGLHFFWGNLFGVHGRLTECWFGWRVKKIFPEAHLLKSYCRGNGPVSDIQALGRQEQVRFWLEGQYRQKEGEIQLSMVLHDTREGMPGSQIHLSMGINDKFLGVRGAFFDWIASCGLAFDDSEKANWPEPIGVRGLDFLGRALETLYLSYIQKGETQADKIDLTWFYRASEASKDSYLAQDLLGWGLYKNGDFRKAETAFASALEHNRAGIGALAGMMWCALCANNREKAVHYALAKAGCRGGSLEKARAFVDKKFAESP